MNNKEAIEYGKRWDRAIESRGDTLFSESRQFLNLAIKALEARPQGEWTNKHFEHAMFLFKFAGPISFFNNGPYIFKAML